MTDIFENINDCCVKLKIDLCEAELAKIAVDGNYTAETMEALSLDILVRGNRVSGLEETGCPDNGNRKLISVCQIINKYFQIPINNSNN